MGFKERSKLFGTATLNMMDPETQLVEVFTADETPHAMTVTLSNQGAYRGIFPGGGEVVAFLRIGIGGIWYNAEVDFVQGVQFTIAANVLTINARYQRYVGAIPPGVSPAVNIAASVAAGVIVNANAPQRTLGSADDIPVGMGGAQFIIPAFAKNVRLVAHPDTAVAQINFPGFHFPVWPGYPWNPPIPIPNDAANVNVSNIGGVIINNYRLIFDLAL